MNHSALLTDEQIAELQETLGVPAGDEWDRFPEDSIEGRLCRASAERLRGIDEQIPAPLVTPEQIPASLGLRHMPKSATQEALGRMLTEIERIPGLGERLVTVAPDVSSPAQL